MYRFLLRPRWLAFHLLVLVGVVVMINLGFWQLRRLDERQQFNSQVTSRIDLPILPLNDVLTASTDPDDVEWRPVRARGTYLPGEQIIVVNRSQSGRAGDMVVTPLALDDGSVLLVERGFVPLGSTETAPAPAGEVEVVGRLRASQQRRRGGLTDPPTGALTEAQRLDIERLADQLPGRPVPMYLELVGSDPAEIGPYPEPVAPPKLDDGPHLSYAVQWFIFAMCAAVGWVLAVRRSISARRGSRPVAAAPTTAMPGPAPPSSA